MKVKNVFFTIILVMILHFPIPIFSEEINIGLRIVFPYVMLDSDGKLSGLEYEIIVAALAEKGYTTKIDTFPLSRVIQTIKQGDIQAAAPILPSHNTGRYLSDVYIIYNNIALGLKSRNQKAQKISDLKGKRVVAFQRATIVLGPKFKTAMQNNPNYSETANQTLQIRMLFANRADFAIGEERILKYLIFDPATKVDSNIPVTEFRVFPPTQYRVAFVSEKHKIDFNEGLAKIKAKGIYDKLITKYTTK